MVHAQFLLQRHALTMGPCVSKWKRLSSVVKWGLSDKPAYWILPSNVNQVHAEVVHKIDYTSAATQKSLNCLLDGEPDNRPGLRTCARKITTQSPTHLDLTQFYADLHKTGGKSAILSVLPHYCEEFRDPVQPVTNLKSLLCLRYTRLDGCDFSILEQHCQALKKTSRGLLRIRLKRTRKQQK